MVKQIAIEVKNLIKTYRKSEIPAVSNISFLVEKGVIFGLLGPNGAGKTTTLSILCGLLKATSGEIWVDGLLIDVYAEEIKKRIGVVPQDIALYPTLTAFENLQYIGNMYGLKGSYLKKRIAECLNIFGLDQHANKQIIEFSGGMKRRINLIAGILHHPKILFLDEPTVGIDVQSRNVITEFLITLNKQGTTIIYTSHVMEEAEKLCNRIAIIDKGEIVTQGAPQELIAEHSAGNLEQLFLLLTGKSLRD